MTTNNELPPDKQSYYIPSGEHPYGYKLNISQPYIRRLYDAWKRKYKIPPWAALSDHQRLKFEFDVMNHILKGADNPKYTEK